MNNFLRPTKSPFAALLVALCLLAAPVTAWAKKGEKNFKRGLELEAQQKWEQAAQEFALAVAALPSDTEYQLHYRRALFNASQVYMQQGSALAERGDYKGAYNAFRQAFGYDPVNQLAAAEMERMLRLQAEKEGTPLAPSDNSGSSTGNARVAPTAYQTSGATDANASQTPPPRAEVREVIKFDNQDIKQVITQLARALNLNVIFDRDFQSARPVSLNLRDVTAAQALDYLFQTQQLFFQRLGRRTIVVYDINKRPFYQQLVLKTFYLMNIKPNDARAIIQQALPANAARQPQVISVEGSNIITVRDTPENIRIIGDLLKSLDKEKAEVVMDVSIYEVSRSDLLQLGNQIGNSNSLGAIFTSSQTALGVGGAGTPFVPGTTTGARLPVSLAAGFLVPDFTVSAYQKKDHTRLIDHVQLHAFDQESTSVNIGQQVPVQTASVPSIAAVGTTTTPTTGAVANPGVYGTYGYPVINYQNTGLTLKFKPQVYPNEDVEVQMDITSSAPIAGANALTPAFNQRTLSGKTRIPNNRTMMLASVSQDTNSNGTQGLPLVGLIPIFGRLFTTPTRNDSQSDVVITVTPRVIRAPSLTPDDDKLRPGGTMQSSPTETLEALVQEADREDQLAALAAQKANAQANAKTNPNVNVAAPSAPASSSLASLASPAVNPNAVNPNAVNPNEGDEPPAYIPAPKPLAALPANAASAANQTAATDVALRGSTGEAKAADASSVKTSASDSSAELRLVAPQQKMKVGERMRLLFTLSTDAPLNSLACAFKFDPRLFAVRGVSSDASAMWSVTQLPSANNGVLTLVVNPSNGALTLSGTKLLFSIEVEALAAGEGELALERDAVQLISADGRNVKLAPSVAAKINVTAGDSASAAK